MVITGVYYALAMAGAAVVAGALAGVWAAAPFVLLALFFLNFFRDPERTAPQGPHAVSPADGVVVAVVNEGGLGGTPHCRVSIFLNPFDVHVNRSPIGGLVEEVRYKPGLFLVASREEATAQNEQNVITVLGDNGIRLVYSQIAGLLARRVVCWKKAGDRVAMGERIGLMKFGSRMDVFFGPEWDIAVAKGQRVRAAETIIARLKQ